MTIRAAGTEDLPTVLALWKVSRTTHATTPDTRESLERLLAHDPLALLVAEDGSGVVGTLIHAIAAMRGVSLAGAIEAAGAAVIGRDAGELAGLGPNGVKVTTDPAPLLKEADALIDFTVPAATRVVVVETLPAGVPVLAAGWAPRLRMLAGNLSLVAA